MTVNLSSDMITVIAAVLRKTPHPALRKIRCGKVDGNEAYALFEELHAESQRLFRSVKR